MNDIVKQEDRQSGLVTQIERIASDPNIDIAKLETLWSMQEKAQDRLAKMAYNTDMASMQSEMPIIPKNGKIEVNKVVRSKYVLFEDVIKAIQPFLDKYGFSVSFKTEFHDSGMQIHGVVSHSQGHEEQTTMMLPFDASGSKNAVQAIGSSVSYGKRYCLCMLLNIAASGEDLDGSMPNDPTVESLLKYNAAVRELFPSIAAIKAAFAEEDYSTAAEVMCELTQAEKDSIWKAPSKGGIFTTKEISTFKSNEYVAARNEFFENKNKEEGAE